MVKLEGTYAIDSLENIGAYARLGANFAKACEFLAKGDFGSLKPGRNDIDGDNVFVNCVDAKYVAQADRPNEIHRKYFDIHIPLAADERIGLGALDPAVKFDFDEASDSGVPVQPLDWFTVKRGEFAICWPVTCPHAPAVTTDAPKEARKLIVKVRA